MTNPASLKESEVRSMLGSRRWLKWIMEYRFVFIVIVLLVQNLLYVTYTSLGLPGENLVGSGSFMLLLIFCVVAVSRDKKSLWIGLIWGGIAISGVWHSLLTEVFFWPIIPFYLSFYIYTTTVIIYNVTVSREINLNIIFGSIAGFLLIGVIGSVICTMIEIIAPGSFTMTEGMENPINAFFYFSFITMTSLGYGDITPATDITRNIAVYLVLFGQLYLAIQVAILVGKFIASSGIREKAQEIEDLRAQIRSLKEAAE